MEFNKIILLLDPCFQNYYIFYLMLYLKTSVGLIQKIIYYYTLKMYKNKEDIY